MAEQDRPLRLSASVVVYGDAAMALRCVESLAAHTKGAPLDIYLIDNASPDGALAALQKATLPAGVTLLPQAENRGYGAGHNAVLGLLRSRYHAVVNPDIVLYDDAITSMARWMEGHPDVVITAPHLVYPQSGETQQLAKRRPALLPLLARQTGLGALRKYEDHYLMRDEDLTGPTDVEFISGSFFVIRTEAYRQMGGFDEGYFMYVEDADITQKALQRGRAVYLPGVTVGHEWQRAARKNPRKFVWQLRSMVRYFRKWGFRWK